MKTLFYIASIFIFINACTDNSISDENNFNLDKDAHIVITPDGKCNRDSIRSLFNIEQNQEKANQHYKIACSYVKSKHYDSAYFHYRLAYKYGFTNKDTLLFNMAIISYSKGNYYDAINLINLALRYDSTFFDALNLRGSCYLVLGDTNKACIDYEKSYKNGNKDGKELFLNYYCVDNK